MKISKSSDVVIVGGGPAGSMTAMLLAQKGYHVVLFDKQRHPRYAVGESLIPDFWKYTDLVGVSDRIEQEAFVPKAGSLVTWDQHHQLLDFADFGYNRSAVHVERDSFDHILLSHAKQKGVEVYEEISVGHIQLQDKGEASVSYHFVNEQQVDRQNVHKIQCRYVIDASGQASLLGRQLGLRQINKAFRFLSVWGTFKGGHYLDKQGQAQPMENKMHVPPTTYITSLEEFQHVGWCWHFPLRDKVSVGLIIPIKYAKSPKVEGLSWDDYFHQKCRQIPVIRNLLKDAEFCVGSVRTTRDFSYHCTQVAGPGFFLVGDAAGFIDPVFSIGVVLGLYTADMAAWAIDRSLAKPKRAEAYQQMYTKQTQGRFELARSLAVPRYEPNYQLDSFANNSIELASDAAQALMHSASSLTGRSENFTQAMADQINVQSHRLKTIEQLSI